MLAQGQSIAWLDNGDSFPPVEEAIDGLAGLNGLLASSHGMNSTQLKSAYEQGIFPWYSEGQPILWWSTDPRMVLYLNEFKLSRSLKKSLIKAQQSGWEIRLDNAFELVMRACASVARYGQSGTWITDVLVKNYLDLHRQGFAHSFEAWHEGKLIGGGYGVVLGRMFYGESMFAYRTDASKIALASLVPFLSDNGFRLIDCQQNTSHLASLGAREISRSVFLSEMSALRKQPVLTNWPEKIPVRTSW